MLYRTSIYLHHITHTIKVLISEVVIPWYEFHFTVSLYEVPDDVVFGAAVHSNHLIFVTLTINHWLLQILQVSKAKNLPTQCAHCGTGNDSVFLYSAMVKAKVLVNPSSVPLLSLVCRPN